MTKIEKKEKANHNFELAKFLIESEKTCSDWIVTILFYSTIHYIDFLMFPLKINFDGQKPINCRTFDQAYNYYRRNSDKFQGQDRHTFRLELFKMTYGDSICYFFQVLKNDCYNDRYQKYSVNKDYEDCYNSAKSLKEYCLKSKPIVTVNLEKAKNL